MKCAGQKPCYFFYVHELSVSIHGCGIWEDEGPDNRDKNSKTMRQTVRTDGFSPRVQSRSRSNHLGEKCARSVFLEQARSVAVRFIRGKENNGLPRCGYPCEITLTEGRLFDNSRFVVVYS